MKTITVQPNQSATDVVLQAYGSLECAMDMMLANGRSLTAPAETGTMFSVPDHPALQPDVLAYFKDRRIVVATKGE